MRILLRIITLTLLLQISNKLAYSQNQQWTIQGGGTGLDFSKDIAVDAVGNSYITGSFSQTATFGDSTLTSKGENDIFLAKYDTDGKLLWVKSAGGLDDDDGGSVALDAAGNCYIAGQFSQTASFDTTTITSSGRTDAFIAKYDANGNVVWVKKSGGSDSDFGHKITVDATGNSYFTGSFTGSATFGTSTFSTREGKIRIFIVKYDSNGNVLWIRSPTMAGSGHALGIAVDAAGNSYVTGWFFEGSITFDTIELSNSGNTDIFIVKFDPNGNTLWARSPSGTNSDQGHDITVDAVGNSYITGYFTGTINFGAFTITSKGDTDAFIAKYDPDGNVSWINHSGGKSLANDYSVDVTVGRSINIDKAGNSYVTGYFYGTAGFGDSIFISNNDGVFNNDDVFIVKYDVNGNILWAKQVGGLHSDSSEGIGVDANDNCYVVGQFDIATTFGTTTIPSLGRYDIFLTKINSVSVEATITIGPLADSVYCAGTSINVPLTFSDSFKSENVFTVQLSDAIGSFANPIVVGAGTTSPIAGIIPANTPLGTHYRIRILSSSPAVMGDDNGTDLIINPSPDVSAGTNEVLCANTPSITLSGFNPAGGTWSGSGVTTTGSFNPATAGIGAHTLTYSVQAGKCINTSVKIITVTAPPVIVAAAVPTECGTSTTIQGFAPFTAHFTNNTTNATGYLWEFGDGTTSNMMIPAHQYAQDGNFDVYLTAVYGNGCSLKQKIANVIVNKKQLIPNIFTPNGDGLNETFAPRITCLAVNLKVYNRYGKLVYEQANYQNDWNGGVVTDGVYYYQLTTANGFSWKGTIEIIR